MWYVFPYFLLQHAIASKNKPCICIESPCTGKPENQCEVALITPHWLLRRQKRRNFHTLKVLSTWCYKSCRNVTHWYCISCTIFYVQIKALPTKTASLVLMGVYHKQITDSLAWHVMKHRHNNPVTTWITQCLRHLNQTKEHRQENAEPNQMQKGAYFDITYFW